MVTYTVLRCADSGLLPWLLIALFILGLIWVSTRNLDSKDTLTLLSKVGTLHGFAWIGWIIALLEIPAFTWAVRRANKMAAERVGDTEAENEKVRNHLKKTKQAQLELGEQ